MKELADVLSDYLHTKDLLGKVPIVSATPSLKALREHIPTVLEEIISAEGYDRDAFVVKGSAGQINLNFAAVPWVAIFKKSVTTSATRGYYIVLLFAEDMSSMVLSLNQGYTSFKEQYTHPKLTYEKLRQCAQAALIELEQFPTGFIKGPIDLKTKRDLSGGYEVGAILSKIYSPPSLPSFEDFGKDVAILLKAYEALAKKYDKSLINIDVRIEATEYEEAVQQLAERVEATPKTFGPQPLPIQGRSKGKESYLRSPDIAARAIAMSEAKCALASDIDQHRSFVSGKTGKNYVEAHHLVPFSYQKYFSYSLDIEENITALCPNCHRLLHHGQSDEKTRLLKILLENRKEVLAQRGIYVSIDTLKGMYKILAEDD